MVEDIYRRGGSYTKMDRDVHFAKERYKRSYLRKPVFFAELDYAPTKAGLKQPKPKSKLVLLVGILSLAVFEEMVRLLFGLGPTFGGLVPVQTIELWGQMIGTAVILGGLAFMMWYYFWITMQGTAQGLYSCSLGFVVWFNGSKPKNLIIDAKKVLEFYIHNTMDGPVVMAKIKGALNRIKHRTILTFRWDEDAEGIRDILNDYSKMIRRV